MTRNNPTSVFEKKDLVKVEKAYPRVDIDELLKSRSSPEVIKQSLISRIAEVNPELATELMQSPTEGEVIRIMGLISGVPRKNNKEFSLTASNDAHYGELNRKVG